MSVVFTQSFSVSAESLVGAEVLVALRTVVCHVCEDVKVAGQEGTQAAAGQRISAVPAGSSTSSPQAAQQGGAEAGGQAHLRLRLGHYEEGAVGALRVEGQGAKLDLRHLQAEGNVVEDSGHTGGHTGVHTRHLTTQPHAVEC